MHRISGLAFGEAKTGGTPTVLMVTGTGNAFEDGRFCLTNECCSDGEIEYSANVLIEEIEEWRAWAKRELRKRKMI